MLKPRSCDVLRASGEVTKRIGVSMANTSAAVGTPVVVELTENDIPGAALAEPLESHTVPALKWWLLCRGIKVPSSWKKQRLIAR